MLKTGFLKRVGKTKNIAMKKVIFSWLLTLPLIFISVSLCAQDLDRECINANSAAQVVISEKQIEFAGLSAQILSDVQAIIQQEAITNLGNMLSFDNLQSVVSVAN